MLVGADCSGQLGSADKDGRGDDQGSGTLDPETLASCPFGVNPVVCKPQKLCVHVNKESLTFQHSGWGGFHLLKSPGPCFT